MALLFVCVAGSLFSPTALNTRRKVELSAINNEVMMNMYDCVVSDVFFIALCCGKSLPLKVNAAD